MINAAVIGLGRWGKSLVTAVQGKSARLRFVHGVSKEPDDVRAFAQQHGFKLTTDLKDAIDNPDVQAIFLATPHSLHVAQVAAVARAGKAVWCEKPLALTRAEAARSVAATAKAGVVLGSGNNKRCFASMRELKALGVAQLYGLSTQDSDYQREAVGRLKLPFPVLSDDSLAFARAIKLPRWYTSVPQLRWSTRIKSSKRTESSARTKPIRCTARSAGSHRSRKRYSNTAKATAWYGSGPLVTCPCELRASITRKRAARYCAAGGRTTDP